MTPVDAPATPEESIILEQPEGKPASPSRPHWLPSHVPELNGLRGLAILGVFFFHSHPRLSGTWLYSPALWGWSGVNLFFVLSGFLITLILLEARETPRHYFRNFYARRILRVWPVYFVLLAICYVGPASLLGKTPIGLSKWQALPALIFFIQNLYPTKLLGALEPTWSLAIEEQYYFAWAPIVLFVRRPWQLAAALAAALAVSPFLRLSYGSALNPTHTLFHLDSIVLGSLLGLGIMKTSVSRCTWICIGIASVVGGFGLVATLARGTAFADLALGVGFAGMVLVAITTTGTSNPIAWLLRCRPLCFYGQISYGLYLTHRMLFGALGKVYVVVDHSSIGGSWEANLAVVAIQFATCTAVALLFWHGLEKRIIRLKKHFSSSKVPLRHQRAQLPIAVQQIENAVQGY